MKNYLYIIRNLRGNILAVYLYVQGISSFVFYYIQWHFIKLLFQIHILN